MICTRRHARRVPGREPRADVDAAAAQAAEILRPRHRGGDRAARARSRATWCIPICAAGRDSEPVDYPVDRSSKRCSSKTLGVPLFQEQAMQIAIVAGGFTPGEADQLRRAMATFKRTGTIGTFTTKMIEGMVAHGYPRDFAERCFSQIEGFGEYGFPESHAASFALLVYASAWLKCHYPDVFAAALLNASRWASTRRRRSCATRASTASRCARSTSTIRTGTARWSAGPRARRAPARAPPRHGGRHPHDARAAPRLSQDQGAVARRTRS